MNGRENSLMVGDLHLEGDVSGHLHSNYRRKLTKRRQWIKSTCDGMTINFRNRILIYFLLSGERRSSDGNYLRQFNGKIWSHGDGLWTDIETLDRVDDFGSHLR